MNLGLCGTVPPWPTPGQAETATHALPQAAIGNIADPETPAPPKPPGHINVVA